LGTHSTYNESELELTIIATQHWEFTVFMWTWVGIDNNCNTTLGTHNTYNEQKLELTIIITQHWELIVLITIQELELPLILAHYILRNSIITIFKWI